MSEPKPQTKEGPPAGGPAARGKRPPRGAGGGSNNGQSTRGPNFKPRTGANQSGNRDSDSQASDVSTKRRPSSSSRGGGRGGGPSGRRPSRPGSVAAPSPKHSANPPMPGTSDGDSPALSNLQKVITDLKSMPASASGQNQSQSQVQAQPQVNQSQTQSQPPQPAPTQQAPTYAQTTQSNLTATAAPFQPSFMPGEVPPRHRKAHSMGPTPPGNAGGGAGYGTSQYAPYLDSMSEDAESQVTDSPLPPMAQFSNRQPMGSFSSAPRFSSMASQGGMGGGGNSDQDLAGGSGRPQLAPSFSFGAKRRTNSMSVGPAIGEEDAGFQFPQQNQPPQQQQQQQQNYGDNAQGGQNPHRRTGSEINGIMSQQIALQNQIEALQQQQAQLLQHQLASNQVSSIKYSHSIN
jgi:protein SSD1